MDIGFYYSVAVTLLALFLMFRSYRANSQLETMVDYYKLRMKDREHEAQQRVRDVQAVYDRRLKEAEEAFQAQEEGHQAELRGLRDVFEGLKTSTWDEANKLWVTVSPGTVPHASHDGYISTPYPDERLAHVSDPQLAMKPGDFPVPGVAPTRPVKTLDTLAPGDEINVDGIPYTFKEYRAGKYVVTDDRGKEYIHDHTYLIVKGYKL